VARVHGGRQREAAPEGTVAALEPVILLALHVVRELPLAFDREHAVLEGDLDVLALHVGQFDLHDDVFVDRLVDVGRRQPGATRERFASQHGVEHPVEPLDLQGGEVTDGAPTGQCHCSFLHFEWAALRGRPELMRRS
jgi:hypothetical protein